MQLCLEFLSVEIWKDVPGYEGFYEVSNLGNVRTVLRYIDYRIKGFKKLLPVTKLKPFISKHGYLRLSLSKGQKAKKYFIHRLVALAFIENPENKPFVNHKDGNKLNNKVGNLEWCTSSENELHSCRVLGKVPYQMKPVFKIDISGKIIKEYTCAMAASKEGFSFSCISLVCNGKSKMHKGFYWEFKNKSDVKI